MVKICLWTWLPGEILVHCTSIRISCTTQLFKLLWPLWHYGMTLLVGGWDTVSLIDKDICRFAQLHELLQIELVPAAYAGTTEQQWSRLEYNGNLEEYFKTVRTLMRYNPFTWNQCTCHGC